MPISTYPAAATAAAAAARKFALVAAREAKKKAMQEAKAARAARHGREIFMFHHIQTQQVVYSFTNTLQNKESLAQLPFIGKKSKPPALRKDHWAPFATVSLSSGNFGLGIYHKLREFRRLHETCYDAPVVREKTLRERKYLVMNQKANSIADLAESIRIEYAEAGERKAKFLAQERARKRVEGQKKKQAREKEEARKREEEERQAQQQQQQQQQQQGGEEKRAEREKQQQDGKQLDEKQLDGEQLDEKQRQREARREEKLAKRKSLKEKKERQLKEAELARLNELLGTKVMVRWKNLLDHEYAAKWPEAVEHDEMWLSDRPYTAPKPWVDPQEAAEKKRLELLGYAKKKAEKAKAKEAKEAEKARAKQAKRTGRLRPRGVGRPMAKGARRLRAKEAKKAEKPKEGGGKAAARQRGFMSETPRVKENVAIL